MVEKVSRRKSQRIEVGDQRAWLVANDFSARIPMVNAFDIFNWDRSFQRPGIVDDRVFAFADANRVYFFDFLQNGLFERGAMHSPHDDR